MLRDEAFDNRLAPLDAAAVGEVRSFDEAAFEAFYAVVAPKLFAYIRRVSGDAATAEDILQEAVYRLLRAPLPPMDEAQMRGYLYRTATTLVSDHWRRVERERKWQLEPHPERENDTALAPDVERAFNSLTPKDRALLWLAYVEGSCHREIAQKLGIQRLSVRVLLFRARKRFARILRQRGLASEVSL